MNGTRSICPAPEALAAYVHRGPDAAAGVGAHIDQCSSCRLEIMELFERVAEPEPREWEPISMSEDVWSVLLQEHAQPSTGRVVRLRLGPTPVFAEERGTPLRQLAVSGLRGGESESGSSAATELDLDRDSALLLSVRDGILLIRASRKGRAAAGVAVTMSRASNAEVVAVLVTDRRGRARLPLDDIGKVSELEIRVDL